MATKQQLDGSNRTDIVQSKDSPLLKTVQDWFNKVEMPVKAYIIYWANDLGMSLKIVYQDKDSATFDLKDIEHINRITGFQWEHGYTTLDDKTHNLKISLELVQDMGD